jgi:hypothetical protein
MTTETTYANLEIGLYRQDADSYAVELRFHRPDDQADRAPVRGLARFDFDDLREVILQPEIYGQRLGQSLFADPAVLGEFNAARAVAEASDRPLRLRLFIDRSAPELHNLRWETLRDPRDDSWLLTNERLLFSRFLPSSDWRPVRLRPRGDLRALVAIANPVDLADSERPHVVAGQRLVPLDVVGELGRARQALGTMVEEELVSDPDVPTRVTLTRLLDALRGGYDILYLVCHGALVARADPPGPYLWLEREDGAVARVPGRALVERLKDLDPSLRPRLIVLASCQSAGRGIDAVSADKGALAAIGPRLAQEAGIPAVLAMQGDVYMDTVAHFMPVFFEQLGTHGQIDGAMAVARSVVLDRSDWWVPALFLRLRGGRIWYVPGFGVDEERPGYDRWPALLGSIRNQKCTPILGPGLIDFLFGSQREVAHRWAESEHYPLMPHSRESLPQVAQYLATSQDQDYPRGKLLRHACDELRRRYGDHLTDEQRTVDLNRLPDRQCAAHLNELISAIGARRREQDPFEPHRVLAALPFEVYITTNPDDLLAEALRAQDDRQPVVEICRWKEGLGLPSIYDAEPRYRPSFQRPLVYHLFGHLEEPESLILTEDDYFDYLMWVNRTEAQIPTVVTTAWSANALLFLGFQMEDWNFRVLFRSILNEDRRYRRRRHKSVAVQIMPEEGTLLPARARGYLEDYFRDADMGMYWGSADDFIRELGQRWQDRGAGGGQP